MFRKILLSMATAFSLNVTAMGMSEGFGGSFELKYRHILGGDQELGEFTYRVRAGWMGTANDMLKWGVALSSDVETAFGTLDVGNLGLEQAWVKYAPVPQFRLKLGKFQMYLPNYYATLYDDDYYAEGVMVKLMHKVSGSTKVYAVVSHTDLGGHGDFVEGVSRANVGVKHRIDDIQVHVGVGGESGVSSGQQVEGGPGGESTVVIGESARATYARAYASVKLHNMPVPVTAFGVFSTNTENFFTDKSYNAGVSVGHTKSARNLSGHVNYYNLEGNSWNLGFWDDDYMNTPGGEGVNLAVRYNLWDASNLVAKYGYSLAGSSDQTLVAEWTVNF